LKCYDPLKCYAGDDPDFINLRSAVNRRKRAKALVNFVDPCADLAVLGADGSGAELRDMDLKAFEELQALTESLKPLALPKHLPAEGEPLPVWVNTIRGKWLSGQVKMFFEHCTSFMVDFSGPIPGGTSGSPVLDSSGAVVGVLNTVGALASFVFLPATLPGRMLPKRN
jgi:hypothetical protein